MFRRFKIFFTGMWVGAIVIAVLFTLLLAKPTLPGNKLLKYINNFFPTAQGETITVQMVKNNQNGQEKQVLIENEVTLAELMTLMAENPNCEIELDPISAKLIIKETDPGTTDQQTIKLGVAGDYLGVYRTILDDKEILERITQIKINELPIEWQGMLLEGKLLFNDEVSLLEALDSLDEYQPR